MKLKERNGTNGIFQVFDTSILFDKERLVDMLYTLYNESEITNKDYRMWYKLNENTHISVINQEEKQTGHG